MSSQTLWLDKLTSRWPVGRIRDHVVLVNGFPFDSQCFSQSTGVRLVRIRDLTDGGEFTYVDTLVPQAAMIDSGDLVVGMDGDFNVAVWNGGPAALNQRLCVLRARPSLDQRFLGYLLAMPLKAINDITYFTTVKHLSSSDLLGERIPIPPLLAQRAIAAYLDRETVRIDALLAAKRRMVELLEERWQEVLDTVIWSDVGHTTRVMHVVDLRRQVMYGIVLPGPDVGAGGIAIVKGGDVAQKRLSWEALCKTTPEIEAPFARARVRGGDLVVAIRGGIGDVAIVPEELAGANLTQDVARVAPRPGISSDWLMYALQSPTTQRDVRRRVTGATITGLNIWELERVEVPLASAERQHRDLQQLTGEATHLQRMRGALDRQIALLQERRQALITVAVTGQVDIPGAA